MAEASEGPAGGAADASCIPWYFAILPAAMLLCWAILSRSATAPFLPRSIQLSFRQNLDAASVEDIGTSSSDHTATTLRPLATIATSTAIAPANSSATTAPASIVPASPVSAVTVAAVTVAASGEHVAVNYSSYASVAEIARAMTTGQAPPELWSRDKLEACEMAVDYGFNGRTGNNMGTLAHILFFAQEVGIKRVTLPRKNVWRNLYGILPFVDFIDLQAANGSACLRKAFPARCAHLKRMFRPIRGYYAKWWNDACVKVEAREYHQVMSQYLLPHLAPKCKQVVEFERQQKDSLTIHLRADDLWKTSGAGKRGKLWRQPPCGMYEKIIREGSFKRVLVVTDRKRQHACVKFLEEHPLKQSDVSIEVQSKSAWEDYCALAGSSNVVVTESSFSHTAAVLGTPRTIHIFGSIWDSKHWLLDCQTRPGTTVWMYSVASNATSLYPGTLAGVAEYQRKYPWDKVLGPLPCTATLRKPKPRKTKR